MVLQAVSFVIHVLLTDQHLQNRFAVSPMELLGGSSSLGRHRTHAGRNGEPWS